MGYSTATALADIIDNSLAAKADRIDLTFIWDNECSSIHIADNGTGMTDPELESAMQLGGKDPTDERDPEDLGRFGLGLKTASFSQCRKLTVVSKKIGGEISCLRWDLNYLASNPKSEWTLLEDIDPESKHLPSPLISSESGTLVVWENLDRIVTPNFNQQDFKDLIDEVQQHLSMVFHRLLDVEKYGSNIFINGQKLLPWDPFLINKSALGLPEVKLPTSYGILKVQGFILPHKDQLSEREYKEAGGSGGWTMHQGFYVYRNKRLLVPGSWLGLGRGRQWAKDEVHRLARIRIDLPNTADDAWKIDVRKSRAVPPVTERERLTRLAEDVRDHARRVYAFRGKPQSNRNAGLVSLAWKAEQTRNGIRYRVDLNHPAIEPVIDGAGDMRPQLLAMIRII
jgi:hypothetical protein